MLLFFFIVVLDIPESFVELAKTRLGTETVSPEVLQLAEGTKITVALAALMVVFLTEITSNTAVTTMMVPAVITIARGTGNDTVALAVATAVTASLAFMLPVATPPNALVYGTGHVSICQMVKGGFVLDLVGWIFTVVVLYLLGDRVFQIIHF